MIFDRRAWWAALALAALVTGCTNTEEPATTNTSPPPAPPAVPPGPSTPGPAASTSSDEYKNAVNKGSAKSEADKSEPAKSDAGTKGDEMPKVEGPKTEPSKGDTTNKSAAAVKLNDKEVAEIKTLPTADEQAAALKQAVCPVSDGHLGAMGTPVKVTAEGKTFYLCCDHCKENVNADAKAIVAKLGK